MVSKTVVIKNEQGLHMRPASLLTKEASEFDGDVSVIFNGKRVNAKSVMNIIASCIKCGAEITIECSGDGEEAALEKIVELIDSGFGE